MNESLHSPSKERPLRRNGLGTGLGELILRGMDEPCGLTSANKAADKMFYDLHTDRLTGLHDRDAAERLFEQYLSPESTGAVVAFIDLDKFKNINDSYGHGVGDEALQITGNALMAGFKRDHEIVSRWSGDEFVIVIPLKSDVMQESIVDRRKSASSQAELEKSIANYIEYMLTSLIDQYINESNEYAKLSDALRFSIGLRAYSAEELRGHGSLHGVLNSLDGPDARMYDDKRNRRIEQEHDAVARPPEITIYFDI